MPRLVPHDNATGWEVTGLSFLLLQNCFKTGSEWLWGWPAAASWQNNQGAPVPDNMDFLPLSVPPACPFQGTLLKVMACPSLPGPLEFLPKWLRF